MFRGLGRFYSCGRRVGLFTAGLFHYPVPFPTEAGFDSRLPEHLLRQIRKNEEGMRMLRVVFIAVLAVLLLAVPVK